MTALERIKQIETNLDGGYTSMGAIPAGFLLRAFWVMKSLALENIPAQDRFNENGRYFSESFDGFIEKFDHEFERRMKEEK